MKRAAFLLLLLALPIAVSDAATPPPPDDGVVYSSRGEIYVRTLEGPARRLTSNRAFDGFPAWSKDRSVIAFASDRRGTADIHTMTAAGSGVRRLRGGSAPRGQDLYPAWSPNGRLIAFSSNRGDREAEIYVMRWDGSGVRRLTRTPRHVQNIQPRFSPDGRWIVFASNRIGYSNFELFRVRVDGRRLTRLTFWGTGRDGAPGDDLMPDYSPDGKRIVFVSDRPTGSYGVWTIAADGSEPRLLVRHRGLNHGFPRYSPDGSRIVYQTFSPAARPENRLWTLPRAGGERRLLAPGGEPDW